MAPPARGAVGATFTAMRVFQGLSLIAIIGLTSNLVSELVSQRYAVPSAFVGTLVVACLGALYAGISYILFWDHMLPLLTATAADGLCFVAITIVSCVVGKPVGDMDCDRFPRHGDAANFLYSVFTFDMTRASQEILKWTQPARASCVELKALWALSIATSITFSVSAVSAFCIWKRIKGGSSSENGPYSEKQTDKTSSKAHSQERVDANTPAYEYYRYTIRQPDVE